MKKMVEKIKTFKDTTLLFSLPTLIGIGIFLITMVATSIRIFYGLDEKIDKNNTALNYEIKTLITRQDHVAGLYETCKSRYIDEDTKIEKMQDKQNNTDLVIVEIKTKLDGIESMLIDIKNKIN